MANKTTTTFDKVCRCLEGITNEEAEDIAAKIIAQVAAKRIHCEDQELKKVFFDINTKIQIETLKFVKLYSLELALGRAYHKNHSATNSPQTPD